ncbi:Hypothetical protein A7982_09932 [Minicystis rosea]|nr:Hypothetical protein A7982_09932 [Minicystis rosea]
MALGALAMGCAPTWHVVAQAAPDPFLNQRRFAVSPIDFSGLHVGGKTEAQYLSEKDAKQQASFIEDKAALNDKFLEELRASAHGAAIEVVPATGPSDAPFIIRPSVTFVEPGFYVGVASGASQVEMTVRITTPDGRVLDEIALAHGTDSRSGFSVGGISLNPSSGGRLRKDGEALGNIVGAYLKTRVSGS